MARCRSVESPLRPSLIRALAGSLLRPSRVDLCLSQGERARGGVACSLTGSAPRVGGRGTLALVVPAGDRGVALGSDDLLGRQAQSVPRRLGGYRASLESH